VFCKLKNHFFSPKKHRCSHWFSFIENYNSVPKIGFYVIYFVFHPNKTQWSRAYSNSGSQKYLSSKMWTPWKNITFLFFKRAEWRISKKYAKKIHSVAVLCEIKKSLKMWRRKKWETKKNNCFTGSEIAQFYHNFSVLPKESKDCSSSRNISKKNLCRKKFHFVFVLILFFCFPLFLPAKFLSFV